MSSGGDERRRAMSSLICQLSVSVDGFAAGPNQSVENPIGEGGMALHEWVFTTASWRAQHGIDGGEPGPDSDVVASSAVTHIKYRVVR